MKHVGLNVAADPFMTSAYLGIKGGLVLVVADDPGASSSQNEQDSRWYASFAKIPCLEPADAAEAKAMTISAFDLSEKIGLPVMIRTLTKIAHVSTLVTLHPIGRENPLSIAKDPSSMIAVPANVLACHAKLLKKQPDLLAWGEKQGYNRVVHSPKKKGIISAGICRHYALDIGEEWEVLSIGYYPFNEEIFSDFLQEKEEVWVLEEGDPILEKSVRALFPAVKGKLTGDLPATGEIGAESINILRGYSVAKPDKNTLPKRPPVMCAGCPHTALYESLIKANPSFTAGDIGCYTLGAGAPFHALDTCLCMGASISQAAGIAGQGVDRVASVIGDSTFLHSGIPALISAVYNKANILVLILDNSTTAMTGHQPTPLVGTNAKGESTGTLSLEELCRACGTASTSVTDPFNKEETLRLINEKLNEPGVHVIISRRPCIFAIRKNRKSIKPKKCGT
jgi:indolepyruvate ferredoxin oxidoreductase alpha subunit